MGKLDNTGVALLKSESIKEAAVNRHVLITGLGRGGTTAIAQIFKAFGFIFDNPNSFMESPELKGFLLNGNTNKLSEKLNRWQTSDVRHAWKDPKLRSVNSRDFLNTLPANIATVIVFRDLIATSIRHSSVMGEEFLTGLERYSIGMSKLVNMSKQLKENRTVVLVSYEKLLVNTDAVVNELASIFEITEKDKIAQATAVIAVSPKSYLAACKESVSNNPKY